MSRFPPPGLAPLGYRNYALYWVGQLVSMSGTWIELTATSWLVYQLTDSPFLLGLNGVFRAAPIFASRLSAGPSRTGSSGGGSCLSLRAHR